MDSLAQNPALLASLLLLLTMLLLRQRQSKPSRKPAQSLDTVQAWPARLVPVMAPAQRGALDLLRQALPGHLVLFQVPLSQFVRVSTRQSYAEWYRRAGRLRASFVVCDAQANVVAAVDLQLEKDSEREQARHGRLARVLRSMGLPVMQWHEGELPPVAEVRAAFASVLSRQPVTGALAPAAAMDLDELLSGDAEAMGVEATDFGDFTTMPAALD